MTLRKSDVTGHTQRPVRTPRQQVTTGQHRAGAPAFGVEAQCQMTCPVLPRQFQQPAVLRAEPHLGGVEEIGVFGAQLHQPAGQPGLLSCEAGGGGGIGAPRPSTVRMLRGMR